MRSFTKRCWPRVKGVGLLLVVFATSTIGKEWQVSLSGEADTYPSLEAARDALRAYRQVHPGPESHAVVLYGGTYALSHTFELTEQDSGTAGNPVTYRARRQRAVFITTAPQISSSQFRAVKDGERAHLKASARDHVLVADLTDERLIKAFGAGQGDYGLLTWNEHVLQLAQWPNHAYNLIGEVIDMGPTLRGEQLLSPHV